MFCFFRVKSGSKNPSNPMPCLPAGLGWAAHEYAQSEHHQSVQVHVWHLSRSLPGESSTALSLAPVYHAALRQQLSCCCCQLQLCSEKPAIATGLLLLLLHCTNHHCSWSNCLLLQELMSRMFLVNIPLMFAAVWKVLQMFVDDRVKAKIRFLRKADFHILHEFVDRDSLPESLGGKAKEKLLSDKQGELACMLLICAKLTASWHWQQCISFVN